MSKRNSSDVVAELLTTERPKPGREFRIVELFGDQPKVLEAIKELRRRNVSYRGIAKQIHQVTGHYVAPGAVMNWLEAEERS